MPAEFDQPAISDLLQRRGVAVLREQWDVSILSSLLAMADRTYARIDEFVKADALSQIVGTPPYVGSYRPTASSMLLESIAAEAEIRETIGPLAPALGKILDGGLVCNLDQAWLRRQYPPHLAPKDHHPHDWHQDGALGVNFADHTRRRDAGELLPMLTAWIPLTPCGDDAPGLEYVAERIEHVLPVEELSDSHIRGAFSADRFDAPRLEPGDAVLFWGDVLHRTHLTSSMQHARTSVEFRFLAAERIPERIVNDRYLRLP